MKLAVSHGPNNAQHCSNRKVKREEKKSQKMLRRKTRNPPPIQSLRKCKVQGQAFKLNLHLIIVESFVKKNN